MLDLRLMQGQSGDKGNLFLRKTRAPLPRPSHGEQRRAMTTFGIRRSSGVARSAPGSTFFMRGPGAREARRSRRPKRSEPKSWGYIGPGSSLATPDPSSHPLSPTPRSEPPSPAPSLKHIERGYARVLAERAQTRCSESDFTTPRETYAPAVERETEYK